MLEPQVNSVPTTCPLGMLGGGPHTIAVSRQNTCLFSYPTSFICSQYLGTHRPTVLYLYREAWCRSRCGPWCRWGWRRGRRPSWIRENSGRWRCGCRWSRFLPSARWLAPQGRHSWLLHKQKRMSHVAATANRLPSYHICRQTPTEFVLETFLP